MSRWQIYDPVAGDTYVLPANPKAMTSLAIPHKTTSLPRSPIDGKARALRVPDAPHPWQFTGRVRDQGTYDALLAWCGRGNRVQVTDHYGRVHEVLLMQFLPTAVEKSGVGNPWLFDYQVNALYFRRLS